MGKKFDAAFDSVATGNYIKNVNSANTARQTGELTMINRHQVEGIQGFNNPLTPEAGALAKTGCDIHLEITVIANNPIHSCNYKIPMKSPLATSIEAERAYLIYSAKKIGYTGMAQIADYKSGECLTFRI